MQRLRNILSVTAVRLSIAYTLVFGLIAILIIVIVNSLQFVGISMVIYLAGLQSIPPVYYEASRVDGASAWQQFVGITVPLLQPAFATSIVLNLRSVACGKNVAEGIATTSVGMPPRVHICAIACAIFASFT